MPTVQAVTLGDMVRLVNLEDRPLRLAWNNQVHTIAPKGEAFVPFDLAKLYFGDPRSLETVTRVRDERGHDMIVADRAAEVRRLQSYWQSSTIKFREYIPGDTSYIDEDGISDLMPSVEVYTLAGERILMVADDPYGDTVVAATSTRAESDRVRQQLMDQSDMIAELRRQNQMLMKKLDIGAQEIADWKLPETLQSQLVEGNPDAPIMATVEENPRMVINPKTNRVQKRREQVTDDPKTIDALPADSDD